MSAGAVVATFTLRFLMDPDGVERQEWDLDGKVTHETLLGHLEIVKAADSHGGVRG